jgi:hypothetical protein
MVVLCPYFLGQNLVNVVDLWVGRYHQGEAGFFNGSDLTTSTAFCSAVYNNGMTGLYAFQISREGSLS